MTCANKQNISLDIFSLHFIFPDLWGRLDNESGLTASNVAKYDALHSMVVFKEHSPSHWNKVQLELTPSGRDIVLRRPHYHMPHDERPPKQSWLYETFDPILISPKQF